MLVRDAMGGPVDTCGMDVTVAQVAKRMSDEGHGAMPVAVQGFLVGIITERDILRSVGVGDDPYVTTVNDLMTPDPDFWSQRSPSRTPQSGCSLPDTGTSRSPRTARSSGL